VLRPADEILAAGSQTEHAIYCSATRRRSEVAERVIRFPTQHCTGMVRQAGIASGVD
jgi:hypothetical protein